jgi:hypothetical protein
LSESILVFLAHHEFLARFVFELFFWLPRPPISVTMSEHSRCFQYDLEKFTLSKLETLLDFFDNRPDGPAYVILFFLYVFQLRDNELFAVCFFTTLFFSTKLADFCFQLFFSDCFLISCSPHDDSNHTKPSGAGVL